MANVIPGFIYKPISHAGRPKRRKGRGLVGHVAVSNAADLRPWNQNDWHAYLPKEGPGIQYVDLDYVAFTNKDGSYSLASFESQGGMGTTAQVNAEPWNANQIRLAATFLRHLHDTEGVPLQVMPDSRPTSRGFGTHRLGIDPWRVSAGESWSSSRGKLCPGDRKHEQRFDIVRLAGGLDPEDDMTDEQAKALTEILANARSTNAAVGQLNVAVRDRTGGLVTKVAAISGRLDALTEAVSQLAGGDGLDPAVIAAAAERGAEKALSDLGDALKGADA